jgi:hypothetical protein
MMSGWANHIEPTRGTRRAMILEPSNSGGKHYVPFPGTFPLQSARYHAALVIVKST